MLWFLKSSSVFQVKLLYIQKQQRLNLIMSALFLRRCLYAKNFKKSQMMCSLLRDFKSVHGANPCVKLVTRQNGQNLGRWYSVGVAHNYQSLDNSNVSRNMDISNDDLGSIAVEKAIKDIDFNIQQSGRTNRTNVEEALSMIVDIGCPTKTQSLYLLRSCALMLHEAPADRVNLVDMIWIKLKAMDHQLDIDHFNALLKVYVINNHAFSPSEFLTNIEDYGIQPNKITFQYLLHKYCNDGDLAGASEILEFMREKGYAMNETLFIYLIKGHMRANDTSGAKDIFEAMRSLNSSPSANAYTALACGYAEKGDISAIKSVIDDAQKKGISFNIENYLSIISSLSSDEHVAYVNGEIMELIGKGVREWKHAFLNTALELIHKNLYEIPFKLIINVSSDENTNYSTNIFIRQLIKSNKPLQKIIHYCNEIDSRGLNNLIFLNCSKAAIDLENFDVALAIFQEMMKRGIPVRSSNFWSILSYYKNSEENILSTLKSMVKLGVPADFQTYERHIFPFISLTNPITFIQKIQETGQPVSGVVDPLFHYYCRSGQFDNAYFLTQKYPVTLYPGFDFKAVLAFPLPGDDEIHFKSYVKVLTFIVKNMDFIGKGSDVKRGKFLALLIQSNPSVFEVLLKNSALEIFKNDERCLNVCYDILKENAPNKVGHLRKMMTFHSDMSVLKIPRTHTVEEEENEINLMKKRGIPIGSYLKQLLSFHIKAKNIERAHRLISELDDLGIMCSPLTYSQLLPVYCEANQIEMAENCLKTLKENYPDFKLDTANILDYAALLIKCSKFEDVKDLIKSECKELHIFGSKEIIIKKIRKLFDAAIETRNSELVKDLQTSLMCHAKELQSTKVFYEPLIKMHILRNDLDSAVKEFRNCVTNHRVTPCLDLLLKKCINIDDHNKLESVIDSAAVVEGELVVHLKLLVAFFETGRKMQAVKLIDNLGSKIDMTFLESVCHRLYNQKKVSDLEEFISITQGLDHINKERLFLLLFKLYDDQNLHEKALNLYNFIVKEKLFEFSDETKKYLSKLFAKNNVPFPKDLWVSENSVSTEITSNADITEFQDLLNSKESVLQALKKLESMKKGLIRKLPLSDIRQIIYLLLQEKRVSDISHNVQAMSYIIENSNEILKPLYERFAENGDVESLNQLASFLPEFTTKKSFFNSYLCKAYISSGKHEELLLELESSVDKKNKRFSLIAFEELLKLPHLEQKVINLAKRYLEVDFDLPLAVVWAHYLINEKFDEADELNKQYTVAADKVDSLILRAIRRDEKIAVGKKYIETISKLGVRSRCNERAYGTLLDVLVLKEMHDEATELVKEAKEKDIYLEKHYRSTLMTLKSALERENKQVPFTIPAEDFIMSG